MTNDTQSEWENITIRVKRDPEWPYHGTDIEFNDVRYVREDLAPPVSAVAGEDVVLPMYIRARYISEHVYKLAYVEYENSEIGASTGALDFRDVEQYRVTKEEAEK